jgi:hypothetical protein
MQMGHTPWLNENSGSVLPPGSQGLTERGGEEREEGTGMAAICWAPTKYLVSTLENIFTAQSSPDSHPHLVRW